MFESTRRQGVFAALTSKTFVPDGRHVTASVAPAKSSAAVKDRSLVDPSRQLRRRHVFRDSAPLDFPGMQHTLERDAVRVHAIPWLCS